MFKEHIKYLACPHCCVELTLSINEETNNQIKTGELFCTKCKKIFPIINFIPRFVTNNNYADTFGFEWNTFNDTLYDEDLGTDIITRHRFFLETNWCKGEDELSNELILEVGCGNGRFTKHALSTGATIVSLDYSNAVEANFKKNGNNKNLLIVQGDIYNMPFKQNSFHKCFCIGVLQHTPDVYSAFMSLPKYLYSGGNLVIDVYKKPAWYKPWDMVRYVVRPFTTKLNHITLFKLCKTYLNLMWPISKLVTKLPKGNLINLTFLILHTDMLNTLPENKVKELAYIELFDILSPAYDTPQSLDTIEKWFKEAKLNNIKVHYGYNGIEGHGDKS